MEWWHTMCLAYRSELLVLKKNVEEYPHPRVLLAQEGTLRLPGMSSGMRLFQTCPRILKRTFSWRKMQYFGIFSSNIFFQYLWLHLKISWKKLKKKNFFQFLSRFTKCLPLFSKIKNSKLDDFLVYYCVTGRFGLHISVYHSVIGVQFIILIRLSQFVKIVQEQGCIIVVVDELHVET